MTWYSPGRNACAWLLTLLLLVPYLPLAWTGLAEGFPRAVWWDAKAQSTFWSSVLLSALVCVAGWGLAMSMLLLWLAKLRPLRFMLHGCLLLLFSLSPVIQLTGWRSFGFLTALPPLASATLVLAWKYFPLMVWLALAGLRLQDGAALEAARVFAGSKLALGRLLVPMLAPALVAATVTVAALVFLEAEVPPLLGLDVYASDYMGRLSLDPSAAGAIWAGLPFVAAALAAVATFAVQLRGVSRPGPAGGGVSALDAGRPQSAGAAVLAALAALLILAPVLALVPAAIGGGIGESSTSALPALRTSCLLGALSAAIAAVYSYALADCLAGASRLSRLVLLAAIATCMLVPGTLTGIAVAQLPASPALGALLQADVPLILAHSVRLAPVGTLLLLALRWLEPPALRDELRLTGAPWLAEQRFVGLPASWPGLVAVFGLLFVLALSELSSTILVVAPGTETVILRLYNLMHYGASESVSVLALAQAGLTVAVIVAVFMVVRWRLDAADRTR